jgi:hypothetical protein
MHRWWTVIVWCLLMGAPVPALLAQASAATPTPTEQWLLNEAKSNDGVIDFDSRCTSPSFSKDPKNENVSKDPCRQIRATYLTKLITGSDVPAAGLYLTGASIEGDIDLSNTALAHTLSFTRSRIQGDLDLTFTQVHGNLVINNSAVVGNVFLTLAKVDGYVYFGNSSFSQEIGANGLNVVNLILTNAVVKGTISLISAQLSHELNMEGSTFEGKINANRMHVADSVYMRNGATFCGINLQNSVIGGVLELMKADVKSDVILQGSVIGGDLLVDNSKFRKEFIGDGITVSKRFLARHTIFEGAVTLDRSKLGLLDFSNEKSPEKILVGNVDQETRTLLECGPDDTGWYKKQGTEFVNLSVRDVQAGVLDSDLTVWPKGLDLARFRYGSLGATVATLTMDEWLAWIGKNHVFDPDPYIHLAAVLNASGRRDDADLLQLNLRDAETRKASGMRKWLLLYPLSVLSGYGIGIYTFRVLYWIVGFGLIGIFALMYFSQKARDKGIVWCGLASLSRLLPIIELNKEFTDFFNDPDRDRFGKGLLLFFSGYAIIGAVLAGLVVAALSGLTQHS